MLASRARCIADSYARRATRLACADVALTQSQRSRTQNANLRATRDLLLPRLISGEIDVSDLDIETVA